MTQQLNLNDARFAPQPQRYAAHQGLVGMLLVGLHLARGLL